MTPADAYHEALNSHRHYDMMANTAFSLMVVTMAGIPALYGSVSSTIGSEVVFLIGAIIIHFAIQTYRRFDRYAAVALNVAAAIESNEPGFRDPPIGFATVFADLPRFPSMDAKALSKTYKRIRLVGYGTTVIFLIGAAALAAGWIPKVS